jgi:hypothetical protein
MPFVPQNSPEQMPGVGEKSEKRIDNQRKRRTINTMQTISEVVKSKLNNQAAIIAQSCGMTYCAFFVCSEQTERWRLKFYGR